MPGRPGNRCRLEGRAYQAGFLGFPDPVNRALSAAQQLFVRHLPGRHSGARVCRLRSGLFTPARCFHLFMMWPICTRPSLHSRCFRAAAGGERIIWRPGRVRPAGTNSESRRISRSGYPGHPNLSWTSRTSAWTSGAILIVMRPCPGALWDPWPGRL